MDVKEAVQAAKKHVLDLFVDEGITDVGLEEVDEEQGGCWRITIGFSRPWDRNVGSVLAGKTSRSYKVVRVSDADGRILSVTDRNFSANTASTNL